MAFFATLPATLPTTGAAMTVQYDFGDKGIRLGEGGNIMIDQACQVTVVWDAN